MRKGRILLRQIDFCPWKPSFAVYNASLFLDVRLVSPLQVTLLALSMKEPYAVLALHFDVLLKYLVVLGKKNCKSSWPCTSRGSAHPSYSWWHAGHPILSNLYIICSVWHRVFNACYNLYVQSIHCAYLCLSVEICMHWCKPSSIMCICIYIEGYIFTQMTVSVCVYNLILEFRSQ